jgi:phosphonate transport system substrate-binding protein
MRPGHSRREILSGILACGSLAGAPAVAGEPLKFGLTPVVVTSDIDLLDRLKHYLQRATGNDVKLVTRRTYQEITSLLISGQIDSAWICGAPYAAYRPKLALVAVPLWRQQPLYRSFLIAARDRAAQSLDDLRGDVHAFSDPDSNSGWLVTSAYLAARKVTPDRFFSQTFFTWGHRNVIRAVASGLAASGSVDGYVYEVLRETEPDLVSGTRVVSQSELLGFPPVACAASLAGDPCILRLQRALVDMAGDENGRAVLSLLRLDGFSIQPDSLFDPIAEELAIVRGAAG